MDQINLFEMLKPRFRFTHRPIRLFEAFSGIGCQALAFKRLGVPYVSVGVSEIDKYAIESYKAIHDGCKNFGDITKMVEIPECDVFTYSFPCTDLSKAGQQKGLQNGTRSGLVYEVLRLLHATKNKPQVLIMENVVDLVQTKFIRQFQGIQHEIEKMGYTNYTEVLNAKDYGVAQNRERVFMVSILGDWYYEFPVRMKLEKRLRDYLEEKVDEKYYIKDFDSVAQIAENYGQLNGTKWENRLDISRRFYDTNYAAPTVHTMGGGDQEIKIAEPICLNSQVNGKQPSLQERVYSTDGTSTDGTSTAITTAFMPSIAEDVGVVVGSLQKNAYIGTTNDPCPTLNAAMGMGGGQTPMVSHGLRIRKLTPIECWRLMGIDDTDFHKAQAVVSNSQLYKQAGNGLVVDVFAYILKEML